MNKKWFSASNIMTAVMVVFLAAMVISPQVKAWTIQTLMKAGLFQPKIEKEPAELSLRPLPNVSFRDGNGKVVDLVSLKGKVVFINFWATWCPPCIAEMPSINALYKYISERYIQHNPNAGNGRQAVVKFFTETLKVKPTPIPAKMKSKVVSVVAEGDLVTVAFVREYKHPKDAAKTYTTTWFDQWRIVNGKADEHWDGALLMR